MGLVHDHTAGSTRRRHPGSSGGPPPASGL